MWINHRTIASIASHCPSSGTADLARRALRPLEQGRRAEIARCSAIVRAVLSEPSAEAAAIARSSVDGNTAFYTANNWLARQSEEYIRAYVAGVPCPQARTLQSLSGRGRPTLLLTAHLGNYLPAMMRITQLLPRRLPLTVVKREAPNQRDRLIDALRDQRPIHIARTAAGAARAGFRALRNAEVLLSMGDVPPSMLGRTDGCWDCSFLGLAARLPRGPAVLASRTDALIIPVRTVGTSIELGPTVDPLKFSGEDRAERVHQACARTVSEWIRQTPKDWLLWGAASSVFQRNESRAAGHTDIPVS